MPMPGRKTSMQPETMPGMVKGTTTFQNARQGLAPRSRAASR